MKKITILFSLFIFFACSKDDKTSNETNQDPINEENTIVDIQVELPEEASYTMNSLQIFSLFETKQLSSNGITDLEIFNGENLEFNVVNNSSDTPVLFGLIDPVIQSTQKIDVMSTAKAIIMIGPWALGLSKEEKLQALSVIPTIPGFNNFLNEVKQAVINQDLSSIDPVEMQGYLIDEVADRNGDGQIFTQFHPHDIYVDTEVTVFPVVDFDASYSLSLYQGNTLIDEKLLLGQLDSQLAIDLILTGTTSSQNRQDEVIFNFEADGVYELRARNGLSFDEDHREALKQNAFVAVYEALGIFTGSANNAILSNALCVGQIFNIMKADPEFQVALTLYKNQEIDNSEMAKRIFSIFYGTISSSINVLNSCNALQNNSAAIIRMLSVVLDWYQRGAAFVNVSSILYDWYTLPSEYNACIEKSSGNNSFCELILITTDDGYDFGNVPVGQEVSKIINVTNTTQFPLIIDAIDFEDITNSFNNEFSSDFSSTELEPEMSTEFTLSFNGDGDTNNPFLSAKMIVANNLNEIENTVTLTAEVIDAINVNPQELDFGTVTVNQSSSPQTITIQNISDYPTEVSVQNLPSGYSIDPVLFLTEITANSSINVDVTFQPTSLTADYSSELEIISNDSSQENIIISLSGLTEESSENQTLELLQNHNWYINPIGGGNFVGTTNSYANCDGVITSSSTSECCGGLDSISFNEDGTVSVGNYNYTMNQYSSTSNSVSFTINIESTNSDQEYSFSGTIDTITESFTGSFNLIVNEYYCFNNELNQRTVAGGDAIMTHF